MSFNNVALIVFPEIILSATTRDATVVDGMTGTMVITGETRGAAAVVMPLRLAVGERHIAYRTGFDTLTTTYATGSIGTELLVGDHDTIEKTANDVRQQPGTLALDQTPLATTTVEKQRQETLEVG